MTKKRREPTFAEIVDHARLNPVPDLHVRPGKFNLEGEFFDPAGKRLVMSESEIDPAQARERVAAGALIAIEGCGCGGTHGCSPTWFSPDDVPTDVPPRFVKGFGAPTWIDLWEGDATVVVFLHGDVEWGDSVDWS